ncbi:MAG TPA: hypothetical protein VGU27_11725, partial [Candidatus Eisenbacteria bacterium]|nr:hypothetical protein [Candidatus Eisenbacteria bacterium]
LAFARAARRAPTVGGGAPARTRRASGRGGFGLRLPFVSREGALLVARDLRCMLRTPPQLLSVVLTPLIVIPAYLFTRTGPGGGSGLAILLLLTTLTGPNLMMFGWDGPGVRSLFLLPLGGRDVVLAKNLFYLGIVGAQAALVVVVLALLRVPLGGGLFAAVVLGYAALAFVATTIGTYVSILNPVRPPRRGFARRGPGGAPSLIGLLALGVAGGAVVVLVLFARHVAPAALEDAAGALAALGCLAVAVVVWWLGVQRGGEEFVRRREKLIDVLAKDEGS